MNIKNVCNETLINMRIDEYHDAVSNIQTIILSESYLSESGGGAQQQRHYYGDRPRLTDKTSSDLQHCTMHNVNLSALGRDHRIQ